MYASHVVEYANVDDLFDNPQHPYTQGLFRSMPKLGQKATAGGTPGRLETIPGMVPAPGRFPPGCKFHPRCNRMNGDQACSTIDPSLREVRGAHWAACHHADNYASAATTTPHLTHKRTPLEVLS